MQLRREAPVVGLSKRTLRNWIEETRAPLLKEWPAVRHLGMHDRRRTFATDASYSLAFAGVPIAEQLVISWGGWKQTSKGRETFRQNYLGPVRDPVTAEARGALGCQTGRRRCLPFDRG